MKKLRLLFVLLWMTSNLFSSPVTGLLERIDKGASSKFIIERQKSETDFFELDQKGDKVIIRGIRGEKRCVSKFGRSENI